MGRQLPGLKQNINLFLSCQNLLDPSERKSTNVNIIYESLFKYSFHDTILFERNHKAAFGLIRYNILRLTPLFNLNLFIYLENNRAYSLNYIRTN